MDKKLSIRIITALVFLVCLAVSVRAESVEGTIQRINEAKNTLRLSDGNSYQLPGEFDYSVLKEGMKVLVFYDVAGEQRYISDIEPEGMELPQDINE